MDSHGNSISFLVTTRLGGSLSKSTPNSMISCHLFMKVLFVFHAGTWYGFWTSSSHGISMAFTKKMMGFPVRIWSHFRTKPNCRQKDMRKSLSHFLEGTWDIPDSGFSSEFSFSRGCTFKWMDGWRMGCGMIMMGDAPGIARGECGHYNLMWWLFAIYSLCISR